MYSLTDTCVLCLVQTKSLTSTLSADDDGISLEEKLKCFLIEFAHFKPEMRKHVCMTCFGNINNLYSFRQQCLRNITTLNNYFDKLAVEVTPYKHFLEVIPDNQTVSEDLCMKTETEHELKCEELDIEDSDPISTDSLEHKTVEVNVVVKDEPQDYFEDESIDNENELSENNEDDADFTNESGAKPYVCKYCPESYTTLGEWKKHVKKKHDNPNGTLSKKGPDDEENNEDNVEKDENSITEDSALAFEYVQIEHNIDEREEPQRAPKGQDTSNTKQHKCNECQKEFLSARQLKIHIRIHTGERPYKCSQCEKAFVQSQHLKSHQRVHTGERPYVCEECQKTFATLGNLQAHSRTHGNMRPYKCTECTRAFATSSNLKAHMTIHTGERRYACQFCPKRFSDSKGLRNHIRTHTGEKPFQCNMCPSRFTDQSGLIVHKRFHTGERPYACKYCPKTYVTWGDWQNHERKHHIEKETN